VRGRERKRSKEREREIEANRKGKRTVSISSKYIFRCDKPNP
jgi:hypothetical protein